jgi:hypothetical protein
MACKLNHYQPQKKRNDHTVTILTNEIFLHYTRKWKKHISGRSLEMTSPPFPIKTHTGNDKFTCFKTLSYTIRVYVTKVKIEYTNVLNNSEFL